MLSEMTVHQGDLVGQSRLPYRKQRKADAEENQVNDSLRNTQFMISSSSWLPPLPYVMGSH